MTSRGTPQPVKSRIPERGHTNPIQACDTPNTRLLHASRRGVSWNTAIPSVAAYTSINSCSRIWRYICKKIVPPQSARRVCDHCRRTVFHRRRTYAYVQIPSWHRREHRPSRRLLPHCPAIQTHGPKLPCHHACRWQSILIRIHLLPTEGTDGKKPSGGC